MSLGTNINYLRKLKKITQEQLAEKMNVTRQ
nr:helix-turn-helix transcriptional regulator [Anaerosporobacter faecicola]